jgi:hypothetical protein
MEEVYRALQNNSPRLVSMGARALLERAMIKNAGDQGTFKENLKAYGDYVGLGVSTRDAIKASWALEMQLFIVPSR